MVPVINFFKRHFEQIRRIFMSLTASAMALAGVFSLKALSQEVQPLYGVPYQPVVKYGAPAISVTPMPGPTDIIQSLPSRGVLMAVVALAVIIVFAGIGMFYYLSRRKK